MRQSRPGSTPGLPARRTLPPSHISAHLELEPRDDFTTSRRVRGAGARDVRANKAELAGLQCVRGAAEAGKRPAVENIEEVGADGEVRAFADGEDLPQPHLFIRITRSPVIAEVRLGDAIGSRRRIGPSRRIEVIGCGRIAAVAVYAMQKERLTGHAVGKI